jgi:curved DNA-binding protein
LEFKDYYKILGVPRTATEKEIKAAYRKLARKHHPDLNKGEKKAEARFKEVNEANEVLSDPEKRKRYDELGPDWQSHIPPGGGGRTHVSAEDAGAFSDFFRSVFGGARGGPNVNFRGFGGGQGGAVDFEELLGRGAGRPAERTHPIELTLEEVARGTTRRLRMDSGEAQREIEVKIPAGIREGAKVRVAGAGGPNSDLYLVAHILPHARFERVEDDLRAPVSVPLTTAVLGGEVEVPTLDGRVNIKVPPATPAGRTFRVRGQGLPKKDGARGDLLAVLNVELPRSVGKREQELFEELRGLGH